MDFDFEPVSFDWDWENESWVPPTDRENELQPLVIHSPQPSRIIDVDLMEAVESGLRGFV
jgi:hypothetical protein